MSNNTFQYVFQISRLIILDVKYYRCGNNSYKYFTTSAHRFNQPKTGYNQCGQAQEDLLTPGTPARIFFDKYDQYHLSDLTLEQYNEIIADLELLKNYYNFLYSDGTNDFYFKDVKILSLQKLKNKKG